MPTFKHETELKPLTTRQESHRFDRVDAAISRLNAQVKAYGISENRGAYGDMTRAARKYASANDYIERSTMVDSAIRVRDEARQEFDAAKEKFEHYKAISDGNLPSDYFCYSE